MKMAFFIAVGSVDYKVGGEMLGNVTSSIESKSLVHQAHVGVECPRCHWRQFVEINLDRNQINSPLAAEIRSHLAAWIASRCPDHLNVISNLSKN